MLMCLLIIKVPILLDIETEFWETSTSKSSGPDQIILKQFSKL